MLSRETIAWLQSADGEQALALAAERWRDPVAAVTALRRVWSREQCAAALQQAELRVRASRKFARAEQMLFTAEAFEQASGESVALWRAERFRGRETVADLCCGIGGDTLALARVTWVVGVDEDAERLALAQANARALGLADRCAVVRGRVPELTPLVAAAFADPDRRPAGRRTRSLTHMRPSLDQLLAMRAVIPDMGMKLSPALDEAELDAHPGAQDRELEFISDGGVCKEAVCWLGGFVTAARRATLLPSRATLVESDPQESEIQAPGAYLFEPDPAVIRAHLVQHAAAALGVWKLDEQVALLSGDAAVASPFARCFRVREVLPANVKEIGRHLRARGYGTVVVKRRASAVEPEEVRRQLLPFLTPGAPGEAVVLFTRIGERRVAFLCEEWRAG